jgi:hypothetical protein
LGENLIAIKRNYESLLEASKEVDLEVNAEQTIFMFIFHHQNAGQSHNLIVAKKSFDNVAKVNIWASQ